MKARPTKRPMYRFGWIPDLPDTRDRAYSAPLGILKDLPSKVNLRSKCPPVVNQGSLGSCTGCAIASAHYFSQLKQGAGKPFQPSRLFIYYNERQMEGTVPVDAGAYIRDGFKSIAKQGVCQEALWKYDISKFTNKPPATAYKAALLNQALSYMRVQQTLGQMKGCLADGYPFVFGFTVYESFQTNAVASNGMAPLPSNGESVLGGHAVMAVGYDDAMHRFIVQNSWGKGWGDDGFFYMPYSYLTDGDLSADFWTVRTVELDQELPLAVHRTAVPTAAAGHLECSASGREETKSENRTSQGGGWKVTKNHVRARTRHMLFCECGVLFEHDNQVLDPPLDEQSRREIVGPVNFHWFDDVEADASEEVLGEAETFGALVSAIYSVCNH